jgi:outer membrane protein assembly factor BamB
MNTHPVDPKFLTARILENTPNHDVFYSAATGLDGRIYLGLSSEMSSPGTFGKLVRYDPATDQFDEVFDTRDYIPEANETLRHPHSKLHTSTVVGDDGKVYVTTHMTAPPIGEEYYHYWDVYNDPERGFRGSHMFIHDPATGDTRDFGIVSPRGGCRWMTYNPELEELYITTFLTAHLIVIRLRQGDIKDMGRISQYDFMGPCWAADGNVYTTDCRGFMLRYDPKRETIETLNAKIPNAPWRRGDGNGAFHLLPSPDRKKIYGCSLVGRRAFEFDPAAGPHGLMRDLGTAGGETRMDRYSDEPFIRTMAVGRDGRVYLGARHTIPEKSHSKSTEGDAVVGGATRMNIVAVDAQTGEREDYGVMQAAGLPPVLTSVATTTGLDNTIYFATWKVIEGHPLQLALFNPDGVPADRKPPKFELPKHERKPDPARHLYYQPAHTDNSVYVTHGSIYAHEMGDAGRVPFIPRHECGITALSRAAEGRIFGVTSGKRAHLFVFTPIIKRVMPLTTIGDGPQRAGGIVTDADGRLFIAAGERLYRYDAPEHETFIRRLDDQDRGEFTHLPAPPPPHRVRLEDLGQPVPGQAIGAMVMDTTNRRLYGLTSPGGVFFTFDIDSNEARTSDIFDAHIAKRLNISRTIVCHDGDVYFSGRHGYLIRHDGADGSFENTGVKMPVASGREYLNTLSAACVGADGLIYGGTWADGCLFQFDPVRGSLVSLGAPPLLNCVRAMTAGRDGMIWALCGSDQQMTHLVRYHPRTGSLDDMGMIRSKLPKTWTVHRADVLTTGIDGELYIGENDAISHLLTYHPPIEPAMVDRDEMF